MFDSDPWVLTSGECALAQAAMGNLDEASHNAKQMLERAKNSPHRYTCALGMATATAISVLRNEEHAVRELSAASLSLCEENGFTEVMLMAHVQHGWATFKIGGEREGIAEMESGAADLARHDAVNGSTLSLAVIAAALLQAGEARTALDRIERGLQTALETGETLNEAELHRLRGESILALAGDRAEAETCLRNAIEIARAQGAKLWELRATRSLARLLARHGRRDEARAMLSEIYHWFTEGFDTADLKDAKSLLDELNA